LQAGTQKVKSKAKRRYF